MALPDRIYAQASPLSSGGKSLFERKQSIRPRNVGKFASVPSVITIAIAGLRDAGFEILQVTPLTINIAGSSEVYENAFRTDIVEVEIKQPNGTTSTYLDSPKTETLGLKGMERLALEPHDDPPSVSGFGMNGNALDENWFHLFIPTQGGQVAENCVALLSRVEELGLTSVMQLIQQPVTENLESLAAFSHTALDSPQPFLEKNCRWRNGLSVLSLLGRGDRGGVNANRAANRAAQYGDPGR